MNCCCQQSGLGALSLAPDITFRLGFWSDAGLWVDSREEERLLSTLTTCLRNTGRFRSVSVRRLSGQFNPYYQVSGQTNVGFAQESDLINLIINTIRFHCGVTWEVDSTDQLIIDSVPQSHANDPNVRRPAPAPGDSVPQRPRPDADADDDDGPSFWDTVTKALDMGKQEAQIIVIGGAALVAVLLLKR